jgi:uncharacterized protein (TIGR00251 family)
MKVEVLVSAGAKENVLTLVRENFFKARVKALPTDGEANQAVIKLMKFQFKGKEVRIVKGWHSRLKILAIE